MVIGSSHVRRMQPYSHLLEQLQGIDVDWLYRGGAGCQFASENLRRVQGHRIVVVMLGGNDLVKGASVTQVASWLDDIARRLLERPGVNLVLFPSVWPRSDPTFNRKAR
jgi:hypothetical protein